MTRLIHLTDLHFGAERTDLIAPLEIAVRRCDADLVVVSGDLTHRARPNQFRSAMAFLEGLQKTILTVPGNHDIPLWNFPLRFIDPFRRYRAAAPPQHDLPLQVGRFRLFEANTVDPYRVRSGVLREADVLRVERQLRQTGEEYQGDCVFNVLLCHHPIEEPPEFDRGETRGARSGISRLLDDGLHIVLTGHLHHWQIGLGITPDVPRALLQVQSGTALCGRVGERDHGFAVLDLEGNQLTVTPWIADEAVGHFRPVAPAVFRRERGLWHILSCQNRQDVKPGLIPTAAT